jgi:hypothetical protein
LIGWCVCVCVCVCMFDRQSTRESNAELRRQREAVVADPRTRALAQAVDAKIDVLETQALGNVAWCVVPRTAPRGSLLELLSVRTCCMATNRRWAPGMLGTHPEKRSESPSESTAPDAPNNHHFDTRDVTVEAYRGALSGR